LIAFDAVEARPGPGFRLGPVSLFLPAGSRTAFVGESGCGKSTLLKLVVGLVRPEAGNVLVNGEPVEPARLQSIRRGIGYVIQEGGLFPHLTARGNVTLLAECLGRDRAEIADRLHSLCALARVDRRWLDRYPGELSGGQRSRVGIVRALMLDPPVLLLDEPFSALDPITRRELQFELRELCVELRKTLLLVTHDLAEAARTAERVVLLRAGAIRCAGTLAELDAVDDPYVRAFLRAQDDWRRPEARA
jgi:osmoprotectant transport system ATP-binding protein